MALNNWTGKASFVKSQEIVLITGGASGIGELMARGFAAKGVKVVVLDLGPPKEPFRKFVSKDALVKNDTDSIKPLESISTKRMSPRQFKSPVQLQKSAKRMAVPQF